MAGGTQQPPRRRQRPEERAADAMEAGVMPEERVGLTDEEARAEREAARTYARVEGLKESHWSIYRCDRGHQFELHRSHPLLGQQPIPCQICHADAFYEAPEQTAAREMAAANTLHARLAAAFDTISEWAQGHLDAVNWSRWSQQQREARQKQELANQPSQDY